MRGNLYNDIEGSTLRILYISHLHPPEDALLENIGGMQRVSMQLVDELEKDENIVLEKVILQAPWKGIVFRVALFLVNLRLNLTKTVKEFEPDVILFSSMVTASLAHFMRHKIKVPMVTINHGHDIKLEVKAYQRLVPKIFRALDGVISVSEATRQECIKRGMAPEKGVALPNGFDMSDFKEVEDKAAARLKIEKEFGLNLTGKKLLLTVGRQVKRKGLAWFLTKVLPKVESDVFYLAIGDGPEHENLIHIVQNSENRENILLAGRQPDDILKLAYAAADIFVMPNVPVQGDMEGFGIVLLEANLAGTPAVASNLEGIKDVIEDGVNGYRIDIFDSGAFSSKIDALLNTNLDKMNRSCRQYVLENFAWSNVAQRYISYLHSVIEENGNCNHTESQTTTKNINDVAEI